VPTIVFSTGNVYPLVAVASGGATEETPPDPIGEYAQSALGRERIFEFFSRSRGTPAAIIRLNYAVELRYGVLLDVARAVWSGNEIDLRMGHVNCIWQRDANDQALRALAFVRSPPFVLNVTGAHVLSVRSVAQRFGERLGRRPRFRGGEAPTALLSATGLATRLLGPPQTDVETMIEWIAEWVRLGGRTLAKPTHFQTRDGKF
jgi:nucleoside-diphosphate-sugar epimerase